MKKLVLTTLILGGLLSACAGLPIAMQVVGQQVSVTAPTDVSFPDSITLNMDPNSANVTKLGNSFLSLMGQRSVEDTLGDVLKQQSQNLRKQAAAALKQQLVSSHVFGHVVDEGGNVGFTVGISRFGLSYSPATQSYQLVLDVQAQLTEPHVGVIWTGTRAMKDLAADTKALATKVDVVKLASSPGSFQALVQASVKDLTGQLLTDLQAHPPLSGFGAAAQ